jgi:signal peptidase I
MNELIKKYGLKEVIRFFITFLLYILWTIWIGNYWFLFGLPIIVDIYITKKVNWTPWKKKEGVNHWFIEWLDALIFAVIAVTIINIFLFQNYKIPTGSMEKSLLIGDHLYVSKVAYGPRIPNTPLSIPFMQNTILGTNLKSYSELINWPYKRIAGLGSIKRDDAVVFNFPAGDTVCLEYPSACYYQLIIMEADNLKKLDEDAKLPPKTKEVYYSLGRRELLRTNHIVTRPIDKRDNYIKRCVAIAGDSLQIIDDVVYVNGKRQKDIPGIQYQYYIQTNGQAINAKKIRQLGISQEDLKYYPEQSLVEVLLTHSMVEDLKKNSTVISIERSTEKKGSYDDRVFPFDERYPWNRDQFGPIYIPKKGATVKITMENLPLYERIIGYYEQNDLKVKDGKIYINGNPADSYTFKMNYYWMMGDNRHNSLDSRYWGYVPEDHIVGKPRFVWLSLDKERSFPANIRFSRMFRGVN